MQEQSQKRQSQATMELRGVRAYCAEPVHEQPATATDKKSVGD